MLTHTYEHIHLPIVHMYRYVYTYGYVYTMYTCVYIPTQPLNIYLSHFPYKDHNIVSLTIKQSSLTKHEEVNQTPKAYG